MTHYRFSEICLISDPEYKKDRPESDLRPVLLLKFGTTDLHTPRPGRSPFWSKRPTTEVAGAVSAETSFLEYAESIP